MYGRLHDSSSLCIEFALNSLKPKAFELHRPDTPRGKSGKARQTLAAQHDPREERRGALEGRQVHAGFTNISQELFMDFCMNPRNSIRILAGKNLQEPFLK